jgi:hypothetical protein
MVLHPERCEGVECRRCKNFDSEERAIKIIKRFFGEWKGSKEREKKLPGGTLKKTELA